jgi:hypothetical protein
MLATFAIFSALSAYAGYIRTADVRWLFGGTIILASCPYAYFVMMPVNDLLYGIRRNAPASIIRELMRDWGLLEWGQTAIGLVAACMFAWPFVSPP